MCYTVTNKSLAEMPAYVKIPVIISYVFVVHLGLSYFMVAFTLLTFQRFHKVGELLYIIILNGNCVRVCLFSSYPNVRHPCSVLVWFLLCWGNLVRGKTDLVFRSKYIQALCSIRLTFCLDRVASWWFKLLHKTFFTYTYLKLVIANDFETGHNFSNESL